MTDPFRDPSQITNAFDQFEQNNGPLTRVPASPPVQAPALRRVPQERFSPTPDQITSAFDQLDAKRREEADARATLQSENILKNLTPEMVARVRRVSREQGLSIPLARDAVVEELNKQDTQSFLRTLRRNPGLQAVSTQKGYADLRDDFEALELVEMAGNSVKSYADDYQAGDLFRDIGRGAVQGAGLLVQGAGDLLQAGGRSITAAEAALIESLPGIEEGEGKGVLGRLITFGAKETLSDPGLVMNDIAVAIGVPQERRTFLNDVTSGTGQLVSQIAVVLATGGSPLVMGALGLTQGAGEQGQMQREQDAFGTPEGDAALVTGGTVSAILERFNLDKIINKIPASARNRVMRAVAGGVSEGGTEFAQSLSQQLTALGFYSDDTLDFNESAYEGGVGAAVGAIISGALPGRGRGARATTEELRNAVDDGPVEAAQAAQVELEIARRAVEESKTFSRDPEAIREILDAAGPQEVTLPVEAIDQLLQDGTLTETELDALGITEQLAVQSQISGEVKTTASQLITLEGDAFSELARNTRLAPGQLTAAEAETQVAEREGDVQRLLEELERSEAAELASRNFQTQIADDIRAAGRPAIEAQQAAAILAARYEARAEQFDGVTAAELYAEDNLRIGQLGATEAALKQAAPTGPRGAFTPSNEVRPDNLIELGPEANATTFVHETSHLFAYQLARDVADTRLSDQGRVYLQRQSDASRRWFGQNSKDAWRDLQKLAKQERRGVSDTTAMQDAVARAKASGDPVAYMQGVAEAFMNPEAAGRDKAAEVAFHELWARGFEKYLGTGTAPSSGLREAFASFSTWITNVYRQLRSLNVELSPEITDVFDRLLASEEAIAAEQEQRLYRVPQEIRDAATPEEVQRLAELADEAELEAKIEMQSRVSRGLVQAETEARNQRREELTDEVRERLEKENPAYAALRVIQDQEMPDGTEVTPVILDRTEVEGLIGKEWASRFPRGTMKRNPTGEQKPIPMSDLASLVSLDSPYELAEVMAPVDGLTPIEDAVAAEVEQRMVEEFGTEAAQDLERQQQAMAAVMNEKFGELQVLQARILGRLAEADLQRAAEQEAEQEGAGSAAQDRQAVEDAEVEEQLAGETGDTSAAVNAAFKRLKAQAKRRANIRARRTQSANRRQLEAARRAIDPATINLAADQFVEQMQIADATPGRYRQTADRLTRRIERAIVARDYAMASALLEQRALNTAIARRVADVQDRVQKQRKKWVKLTSRSDKRLAQTYDIDYINAIRVLLNPIDFANLPQSMNFDAALALGQLQQSEPALYAELTSAITQTQQRLQKAMTERQGRDAYKDLTTLEFEQLMKLAENLRTNARDNRSMLADGDRVHFGTVAQMIDVEVDKKRRQRKAPPPDEGRGKTGKRSRMQMIGNYKAALRRVELWARSFDNGRFDGPMQKFLVRPVMAAVNEYNARRGEPQDRLVELLKDNREVGRPMEIAAPELDGYRFQSKAELLHFVLHMGNASNKRKLLIGGAKDIASDRQYVWGQDTENGVDDTQAQAFLDRMFREGVLTKSDMDLVQGIWDTFETTKVAAQAAHKKMYGYNFQEVEATPMQTPFGEYKGGYVPAVTDYMMNPDGQRFEAEEIMSQQSNAAMFPGAEDGFTKSRVEYNRPMNLDLSTLPAHLDRVMKYAYLAPTIRNAARMVTNDAFRAAVGRHDPYVIDRTIIPWLQRTAQQVVQSPPANSGEGQIGRWVARLQRNVGLHVMTANLVNAAQQITGLPSALTRVKLRHLLAAHTDLRQEDGWVWQHIANRSKFMQTRMSNGTNEAMTTVSNILKDKSVLSRSQDFAMRYGYFAQQQMQNMIDPIVWMAADRQAQEEIVPAIYEEALARTGSEQLAREAADKAAVEFADQVVRDTQSPMQASDISGIEASGPMLRLYLQFYSYFNNMGNLLATEVQIAHNSEMGVAGRWGRYAYAFAMTVTVPAVLAEGIKMAATGAFDAEDEEDLRDTLIHVGLGSQVQTLLLMDPALGKLASAAYGAAFTDSIYDDRISAAGVGAADSLIKTWSRAVRAIADPDTDGEVAASARAFLDTAGIALGLPTNWLNKPLRYAERVAEGDADPQGLVDIIQGIVTGRDGTE